MHYGVILNDRRSITDIGPLDEAPYKGAPKAPALYIKPANTLSGPGAIIRLPNGANSVETAATIGLVIGRPAARLTEANALDHVKEIVLACDLSLPHASYYRPSIREKCFDGSLVLGPRRSGANFSGLVVTTEIAGLEVEAFAIADLIRTPARLLADVTEFMTLDAGDVLLVGVLYRAPEAKPGQKVVVRAEGLGALEFSIAEETL